MTILFIPPVWLLPIISASPLVIIAIIIKKVFELKKKFQNINVMLLGPAMSGKTLFCNALQNKFTKSTEQTAGPYTIQTTHPFGDNDKNVKIVAYDNSGDGAFMEAILSEIKNHTQIIFFCDITKYLTNIDYERDVNARLDAIFHHAEKQQSCILFSYADKCEDREASLRIAEEKLKKKPYHAFFKYKVTANLTDKKDTLKAIDEILTHWLNQNN